MTASGCRAWAWLARTLDHISAKDGTGRFVFGTGPGWFERDA